MPKLQEKPALQPSKGNIQHFKTWNLLTFFQVCGSFLPSWIRIVNPDTDPGTPLNPDTDPDPQHWLLVWNMKGCWLPRPVSLERWRARAVSWCCAAGQLCWSNGTRLLAHSFVGGARQNRAGCTSCDRHCRMAFIMLRSIYLSEKEEKITRIKSLWNKKKRVQYIK